VVSRGDEGINTGNITQSDKHDCVRRLNYKEVLAQPNSENSSSTSESLVQLAHDSLHFGELLGIRVFGSVEAAISRITSPLKKAESKAKGQKRPSRTEKDEDSYLECKRVWY